MHPTFIFFLLFFLLNLRISVSSNNQMHLHLCTRNKTVSVRIQTNVEEEAHCECQASVSNKFATSPRSDYIHTLDVGLHKLHTDAKSWNDARVICEEEGGHLAVINSKAEERALLAMFEKKSEFIRHGANKEEAFLGIHDFFKEGEWITVLGESLYATGYSEWSTDWWGAVQPDNKDQNQNCGALLLRGGMDDVHCHEKFAFFCELPLRCL